MKSMIPKLTRGEMIQLVVNVTHPEGTGFSSDEINQQLLHFCANCPDPLLAMDLVVECMTPMTAAELVDRALLCPRRDVSTVPISELAATHPLRSMKPE